MALIDDYFRSALMGVMQSPRCVEDEAAMVRMAWRIAELSIQERKRRSATNAGLYQFAPEDDGVSYESALPRG